MIDAAALLGRPEIVVDLEPADTAVAGRPILVTGAAGSIGAAISRLVAERKPSLLVLLDRAESPLYRLDQELRELNPNLDVAPVLVDVLDRPGVTAALRRFRPSYVIHAAAYKHVPMLERQAADGVRNNVAGTLIVAEAAQAAGVERFILISTDKVMRPSSVMGASKRVCELLLQCLAAESAEPPCFVTVRFGNILDSDGNVVEQFARQIANGGPVTVTHPAMTRYFMTAAEAARLVLRVSFVGRSGDVFLLDIDQPLRIIDLARRMIRMASVGHRLTIPIEIIGPRPGEKLHEDYRVPELPLEATECPFVLRTSLPPIDAGHVREMIDGLLDLAHRRADGDVVRQLARIVTDYAPNAVPS